MNQDTRECQIHDLVHHYITVSPDVAEKAYSCLLGPGEPLTREQLSIFACLLRREQQLMEADWKLRAITAVSNCMNAGEIVGNKTVPQQTAEWLLGAKIERKTDK
jgi:hypothetical protein